jgi:hypothetical protein
MLELLAVIYGGGAVYGFFAWFSGRISAARPEPDPVRAPRREALAVGVVYVGTAVWLVDRGWTGLILTAVGAIAWLVIAATSGYRRSDFAWVMRSGLPFAPILLAIAVPKLLLGAALVVGTLANLASGVVQQLMLQLGLTARIEALVGTRPAVVLAAIAFGALHAPLNLGQAGGDWPIALANGIVLQGTIGLVFCLAFVRHRAPLWLGLGHAMVSA